MIRLAGKTLTRIGIGTLGGILFAEAILRAYAFATTDTDERKRLHYLEGMNARIYSSWTDTSQTDRFLPPYVVFADRGMNDDARIASIFEATRLPPSSTWTSHDFLQGNDRAGVTAYTIHSNAQGFRGTDHEIRKPKGTVRVIVLGSYQAFGHGVEDDQTYAAELERELNRTAGSAGKRFEVWNGGRHASTAIVGLARMKKEIFQYRPDLLILDYGLVDGYVVDDNLFPIALLFPKGSLWSIVRGALHAAVPLLSRSQLWRGACQRLMSWGGSGRIRRFEDTVGAMLALAKTHGVPVVLIRQDRSTIPNPVYERLAERGATLVTAEQVFGSRDPKPGELSASEWGRTWLAELDPEIQADHGYFRFVRYYLDFFQLNVLGHRVLGRALSGVARKALGLSK